MSKTGIAQVVAIAGSATALARQIGIKPQVCHRWLQAGFVPPRRALEIAGLYPQVHQRDLVEPELLELYDAFAV
jgi:DNA-binding transcriptional regulator YdaS (Cro superfamily)